MSIIALPHEISSIHRLTLRAALLGVIVTLIAACGSSLTVHRYEEGGDAAGSSIPFFLPQHEFVVSDLRLDDKGNPVKSDRRNVSVSLVTRRDPARAFLVKNSTGPFSASEFAISRDQAGRITAVSGKSEDKTVETVQALTSFVTSAIGFAAQDMDPATQALIEEKATLEETVAGLLTRLESLIGDSPEDVLVGAEAKRLQEALSLARSRLAAINAALKGSAGAKAFGRKKAQLEVCANEAERENREADLTGPNGTVFIVLVPADRRSGDPSCISAIPPAAGAGT